MAEKSLMLLVVVIPNSGTWDIRPQVLLAVTSDIFDHQTVLTLVLLYEYFVHISTNYNKD